MNMYMRLHVTQIRFANSEKDWLELRLNHITGTDVGAILGYNKDKSLNDVIDSKHIICDVKDNFLMKLGRDYETKLANYYPILQHNPYYISKCGKFMATCDFVSPDEKTLIEIKTTTGVSRFRELKKTPINIQYQVMHQYICSGGKFENVYIVYYLIDKKGNKIDRFAVKLEGLPKNYNFVDDKTLSQFYNKVFTEKNYRHLQNNTF